MTPNPPAPATPTSTTSLADRRTAIAAAAEARSRGTTGTTQQPSDTTTTTTTSSSPNTATSSNTITTPTWTPPTPDQDRKKRLELARIVARDIMGGHGYAAAVGCIETLLQITTNILQNPQEIKYTKLKQSNPGLKRTVLDLKGGREFLVAIGFRARTIDFIQYYLVEPVPIGGKVEHGLRLGQDVLRSHLQQAIDRSTHATASATLLSTQESDESRRHQALTSIDDDRERVRMRTERERVGREARERLRWEQEQAEVEAEAAENQAQVQEGEIGMERRKDD